MFFESSHRSKTSHLPLWRYLWYSQSLHGVTKASSFCWVQDSHCMVQRSFIWGCGSVRKISTQWRDGHNRWWRSADCCKRSWYLLLKASALYGRHFYQMFARVMFCIPLSSPHFTLSFQLTEGHLILRDREGTSAISLILNLMREFDTMEANTFLSVKFGRTGVTVKKLLTRHQPDGLGVIVTRTLGWERLLVTTTGLCYMLISAIGRPAYWNLVTNSRWL